MWLTSTFTGDLDKLLAVVSPDPTTNGFETFHTNGGVVRVDEPFLDLPSAPSV